MNRAMRKTTIREIKGSFGRYMAILLIVALGVGFFAGLKVCCKAMVHTADDYWQKGILFDYSLISTLGFDEDAVQKLEGEKEVRAAEGTKSLDVFVEDRDGEIEVKTISIPKKVNKLELVSGRMPESVGECIADPHAYGEDAIGTKIRISDSNDKEELDKYKVKEYEIVGIAKSPIYPSNERGTTAIGDGKLNAFVYIPEEAFDMDYLTGVYVAFEQDAGIYTQQYDAYMESKEEDWDEICGRTAEGRYDRIAAEADGEIADAEKELSEKKADGEQELKDALSQLKSGQKKLEDGEDAMEEAKTSLAENEKMLAEKEEELQKGLKSYQDGKKDYEKGKKAYDSAKKKYDSQYSLYKKGKGEYKAGKQAYDESRKSYNAAKEQYEKGKEYLSLEEQQKTEMELSLWKQQLDQSKATLASTGAKLDEAYKALAAGKKELAANKKKLDAAKAGLELARKKLNRASIQLEEGKDKLADAKEEISSNEKELERARKKLKKGQLEYDSAKEEFDEKIADAEKKIADAKEERAGLEKPETYVLDRNTNIGYASFDNDVHIMLGMAKVFPVFFFLVAALVCITTMTRMMEEQRTQIGTLKALGYSQASIVGKYLSYSGSAAIIGAVGGFFIGSYAFPYVIWQAYGMIYDMGNLHYVLDWGVAVLAVLAALLCSAGTTVFSCYQELQEMAASLMRPKPPKNGKRVLLERIPFIWNRLKFLDKVSVRNLFRYKNRFFMMIIGISGCTALMVTALGIRDSIAHVADRQFDEIFVYDLSVGIKDGTVEADGTVKADGTVEADGMLEIDGMEDYLPVCSKSVDLLANGQLKGVNLIVPQTWEHFDSYIRMRTEQGDEVAPPKGNEAVISSKLAENYKLKAGDEVTLQNSGYEGGTLKISGIFQNYFNHYVIISPETSRQLFSEKADYNEMYVILKEGEDSHAVSADFMKSSPVTAVSNNEDTKRRVADMMQSLNYVVLLVAFCAALLAFIVIYNLNNINITERLREIATIKVLGFYKKETNAYVFRENIVLNLLGGLLGLLLGYYLHRFVMSQIKVDAVAFDVNVRGVSYAASLIFTIVFNQVVDVFMSGKLEGIDMAESLKSVE